MQEVAFCRCCRSFMAGGEVGVGYTASKAQLTGTHNAMLMQDLPPKVKTLVI